MPGALHRGIALSAISRGGMRLAYFILYTNATHSCFNWAFLELNCAISILFPQNLYSYYYALLYSTF